MKMKKKKKKEKNGAKSNYIPSVKKGSFASVIEIGTKAGFLGRKWNVYIQLATTSSMDKENHLCHCASCKSKLNSKSLGYLTQARALLSIGIDVKCTWLIDAVV